MAILVAITLAGVGYFFIINRPKPQVLPPENTPPVIEGIDTSDWQTYRDETLGFEIKMPKEWVRRLRDVGPQPNDENEFWRDQVGAVEFIPSYQKGFPQFLITIKDSDITLENAIGVVALNKEHQDLIVDGLPAKRDILERKGEFPDYREMVVVKNSRRYYFFEFNASETDINKDVLIWNEILKTFKPISQ